MSEYDAFANDSDCVEDKVRHCRLQGCKSNDSDCNRTHSPPPSSIPTIPTPLTQIPDIESLTFIERFGRFVRATASTGECAIDIPLYMFCCTDSKECVDAIKLTTLETEAKRILANVPYDVTLRYIHDEPVIELLRIH